MPEPKNSQPETGRNTDSIEEICSATIKRVYLKRLVRQDPTGIWTVVGYDQR